MVSIHNPWKPLFLKCVIVAILGVEEAPKLSHDSFVSVTCFILFSFQDGWEADNQPR